MQWKSVNDRKCVFHFRPKPNIWPEKHLALGRIPKPKPNVQIYIKIGGILQNSMFLMPYVTRYGSFLYNFGSLFKLIFEITFVFKLKRNFTFEKICFAVLMYC